MLSYKEEEIPEDDRYIFCDKCQKEVLDYCNTCGMLVIVKDVRVPVGVPERARKTAPSIFEIRESTVHGLGVFVKRTLPQGIQVGPYEGTFSRISNTNGYSWKLRNGKLVDAADETVSNWMRYVNCAPHISAQNLVAFQYKGELFYRTARPIQEGEELLVYYGNSFARELGIEPKKYFDPQIEEQLKPYYTCKYCQIGLSLPKFRDAHEKLCRFRNKMIYYTGETFACLYCKVLYNAKEDRDMHQKRCKRRPNNKSREDEVCVEKEVYVCQECNYQTDYKGSLKGHMVIHDKENARKYSCSRCSYTTIRKGNLKKHLRTHTAIGVLICQCCSKSFNQKLSLDGHYVSKHPDKSHMWQSIITSRINKCPECPYKSVWLSYLKVHLILIHKYSNPNRRKYKCEVCQYSCVQKSDFIRHLRLHVDQLPFVCIECSRRFNRKSQLDRHIVAKHADIEQLMNSVTNKVYYCSKCNYKAGHSGHLKKHLSTHNK